MNTGSAPPLFWVNYSSRNRKALPHRQAVSAHVHGSYKNWRKHQDAISLRKSAIATGSRFARTQEAGRDALPERLLTDNPATREDCRDPDDAIEEKSFADNLGPIVAYSNPQTILAKGNSDPFHAFAIPIDARVARIMTYTSDQYLPGIYRHHNLADRKAACMQAFDEIITFLHDDCTAYPHLARIVAVMPGDSTEPGATSQSVIFKTKGMISLRRRLMRPKSLLDPRIPASVLLFLTAELYDGDVKAASFHARILAHILQTGMLPIDFWFLFKVMYHDMQRACLGLVRPAFDLEMWVPKQYASLCITTTATILEEATGCGKVDASITNLTTRALITEMRYCRDVRLLMANDHSLANNQTNWQFGCRTMACVGKLVNHYLDSRVLMELYKDIDPSCLTASRVDAYTSLALLYLMRSEAKMDTFQIGKKDTIFRAQPKILTTMKELLEQDQLNKENRYSRTKLFVLFVGAWAEETRAVTNFGVPENGWFNVNFAVQAADMGIWKWRDLREILLGYYYSDSWQPHDPIWFQDTMSANSSGPTEVGY